MAGAKPHRADGWTRQRIVVGGAGGARQAIPTSAVRSFPLRDADDRAVDGRSPDSDPAFRPRYLRRQLRAAGADAGGGAAGTADRTDAVAVRPDAVGSPGGARPRRRRDAGRDCRDRRGCDLPPCARNCARCWKRPDAPARPKWCRCSPTSRSIAARRKTNAESTRPSSSVSSSIWRMTPLAAARNVARDHSCHRLSSTGSRQSSASVPPARPMQRGKIR